MSWFITLLSRVAAKCSARGATSPGGRGARVPRHQSFSQREVAPSRLFGLSWRPRSFPIVFVIHLGEERARVQAAGDVVQREPVCRSVSQYSLRRKVVDYVVEKTGRMSGSTAQQRTAGTGISVWAPLRAFSERSSAGCLRGTVFRHVLVRRGSRPWSTATTSPRARAAAEERRTLPASARRASTSRAPDKPRAVPNGGKSFTM